MKKQFVTHRVVCAQTLNVTLQLRVNNKLDVLSVAGVGYQPGESVIFAAADELPLVVLLPQSLLQVIMLPQASITAITQRFYCVSVFPNG